MCSALPPTLKYVMVGFVTDIFGLMSVTKPTITYFNVGGRAEHIRLLLEVAAVNYDYIGLNNPRYPTKHENWEDYKAKNIEHLTFGQVPRYQDSQVDLVQSSAIMRYLAKKHGFNGSDEKEALLLDVVFEGINDLSNEAVTLLFRIPEEHRPAKTEEFLKQSLPKHLNNFKRILNNKNYLVGNKLSYVDLYFFTSLKFLFTFISEARPVLTSAGLDEYYNRIQNEPKIKAFYDSDPYKSQA